MAEECYNRMYRLYKTYPFLVQLCLWLKTPSKAKQQKQYRRSLKLSRRMKHNSSYYPDSGFNTSFVDNRYNQSMDFYNNNGNRSMMRYSMNDPNDYQARNDSFANPLRMSQAPFYNFNRGESIMYDDTMGPSMDPLNNNPMYFEKSLGINDEEYYDYQRKRMEIMKMKMVLERLAFVIQYLQYSSPFLLTALLLYIYKKKAREWMVLFKCAYQLITYQLKDPYVIVTSPKKKRITHHRRH